MSDFRDELRRIMAAPLEELAPVEIIGAARSEVWRRKLAAKRASAGRSAAIRRRLADGKRDRKPEERA